MITSTVIASSFLRELQSTGWKLTVVQGEGLKTTNRQNGSGMHAITVGSYFRGNTSSAVARPPLTGMVEGVFSGILGVTSLTVAPGSVLSVEW